MVKFIPLTPIEYINIVRWVNIHHIVCFEGFDDSRGYFIKTKVQFEGSVWLVKETPEQILAMLG